MSLEPLNQVLTSLQKKPMWQEQQQFQHLLKRWPQIVGPAVGAQTRPITITQRAVLKVATSSSAWAQNLAFERHLILEKLNTWLVKPLVDIQFSSSQWQTRSTKAAKIQKDFKSTQAALSSKTALPPEDAQTAFQNWAKTLQARSRQLPLCPRCQCPTPASELQRWSICALCAARRSAT